MILATHLGRAPLGQSMASRVRVLWHPSYYYGFWPGAASWTAPGSYESPRRW